MVTRNNELLMRSLVDACEIAVGVALACLKVSCFSFVIGFVPDFAVGLISVSVLRSDFISRAFVVADGSCFA